MMVPLLNKSQIHLNFLTVVIICLVSPRILAGDSTLWSSESKETYHHWHAPKSELRDNDLYKDSNLIGGINLPGGGTMMHLSSIPNESFDFIKGDRLNFSIWIEGDMGLTLTDFQTDYHLLVLPLTVNGTNFFEILFGHVDLLENLTKAVYNSSTISENSAELNMKYQTSLDVQYAWDLTTGLLTQKMVTAPSGLQLIVVNGTLEESSPTTQNNIPGFSGIGLSLFAILGLGVLFFRKQVSQLPDV